MRIFTYDTLEKTGRNVTAKAYLRGGMVEEERLRTVPRDPTKSAVLARMASTKIRRNPMRRNAEGTLLIPCLLA